eukprot:jgi/Botrbrau1/19673/Bobra.0003s0035.1
MGKRGRLEPVMCLHMLLCTAFPPSYLSACAAESLRAGGPEKWRGFLEGLSRMEEGPQPQPPPGASWARGEPSPWVHPRRVLLEGLQLAEGVQNPSTEPAVNPKGSPAPIPEGERSNSKGGQAGSPRGGRAIKLMGEQAGNPKRGHDNGNPKGGRAGNPKGVGLGTSLAGQAANPKADHAADPEARELGSGIAGFTDRGRTDWGEDAHTWLSKAALWISNAVAWVTDAAMASNEQLTRREMREGQAIIPLPEYWRSRRKGTPGRPWPSIFMYRLPPVFKNDSEYGWNPIYGAEEALPVVLKEMGHVVEDPEDADLYYLDAWFYNSFGPILDRYKEKCEEYPLASCRVLTALDFIRYYYPYFERSGGVDHIWPLTYDHGFCGFGGASDMALGDIFPGVIAEHWGYSRPEFFCADETRYQNGRCYDLKYEEGVQVPRLPCYVNEKDVLMPSAYLDHSHGGDSSTVLRTLTGPTPILPPDQDPSWPEDTGQPLHCATVDSILNSRLTVHIFPNRPRNITLFFVGRTKAFYPPDPMYSHGVRQSLYSMFAVNMQPPGFRILEDEVPDMLQEHTQARFALAATGGGFGVRLKVALLCGNIPVIISDHVAFENNDIIDLRDISIRIPERYTYMLPEVLAYLEEHHKDTLEAMQKRIACAWRYWVWTLPYGRAGEAFVCSLRRKLLGHQALLPRMDWDSCTLHCEV